MLFSAKRGFLRQIAHISLSLFCLLILSSNDLKAEEESYILTTATTGGTYYPVGVAIATLIKVRLQPTAGISLSAISSAGSAENVKLLREDEAQFAILQGIFGAWAWNGDGPVSQNGPQTHLRAITMLWNNAEHFVIRASAATTGTMDDLQNLNSRKFSIGRRNSGAEQSGRYILKQLGMEPDEAFSIVYQGYGPSADSLINGTIDGVNIPAGVPVSAVTRAFASASSSIRLLGFTEAHLEKINAQYPLWGFQTIPADTYPGQTDEVTSIAHPNILAVRADVNDETVYQITKTIYENLPFLNGIHQATKDMSLDVAIKGLPMPLHPGAQRYYAEQGLEVPETLTAP